MLPSAAFPLKYLLWSFPSLRSVFIILQLPAISICPFADSLLVGWTALFVLGKKRKGQTPSQSLFSWFLFRLPLFFFFHFLTTSSLPTKLIYLFPCDHAYWPLLLSCTGEKGRRDKISRRRWCLVGTKGGPSCPLQCCMICYGDRLCCSQPGATVAVCCTLKQ